MARSARSRTRLALALAAALGAESARAGDVSVKLDAGSGFSIKNSTGTVERLRVDETTGNISRNGMLFVHTTGPFVGTGLFVGYLAGVSDNAGGNTAFGHYAMVSNSFGYNNTAVGFSALAGNEFGFANSALGFAALRAVGDGYLNSAVGYHALSNGGGSRNSALGAMAMHTTTGSSNVAVGEGALSVNTVGNQNTAAGAYALIQNLTGNRNVAVGFRAGLNQTTGSDNIYLANEGVAGESGQIKIGTVGTHTGTTIAGISGATSASGIAVLVNASGKLGTTTSSARFKEDVRDMADASDVLMKLRPVTFRYRESAVGAEESQTPQYGLIAEEVAEVAPELVAPDLAGRPYSVKYHELPALLVNEAQAQRRVDAEQQRTIEAQRELIASLSERLAALEGRGAR